MPSAVNMGRIRFLLGRPFVGPLAQGSPPFDIGAYPVLTEEVGFPPSPLSRAGGASTPPPGSSTLGPLVSGALQAVLGWKINSSDAKGFVGALNQSFKLSLVEGRVESSWTPRSYAVQTDLAGGITGAQASIYTMAKAALDQSLPLLDGLRALDPASDPDDVAAVRGLVRSQLTELVNELGYLGGPRVLRVNQYFQMLFGGTLGPNTGAFATWPAPPPNYTGKGGQPPFPDPQGVFGTLGDVRDLLGLYPDFINTVDDEQNVTNFRILSDYVVSLHSSWQQNFKFFTTLTPFLGTQLILLSRQLSVVSESVDEVRFILDSLFVGPSERQTLQVQTTPPMFLEDLLSWIQRYVTEEAPSIIQSGGRFALGEDFSSMIGQLLTLAQDTLAFAKTQSQSAIGTARALKGLTKLEAQLQTLLNLAKPVGIPYLPPRP